MLLGGASSMGLSLTNHWEEKLPSPSSSSIWLTSVVRVAPSSILAVDDEMVTDPVGRSSMLFTAVVAVLALSAFPWLTRLVTRMTRRLTDDHSADVSVSTGQVMLGSLAMALGWTGHGLSLWWTLEGLGVSPISDCPGTTLAGMTAVAGLATALGFLAFFAPGGVGVREGVLIEGLSRSGIPLQPAVLASVALRAVWLLAELVTSVALYYGHRPLPPRPPTSDSPA